MRDRLFRCPMCGAEVFGKRLEDFRCPVCGHTGGNQLSLFRVNRENDGTVKDLGWFDPAENARRIAAGREKERDAKSI